MTSKRFKIHRAALGVIYASVYLLALVLAFVAHAIPEIVSGGMSLPEFDSDDADALRGLAIMFPVGLFGLAGLLVFPLFILGYAIYLGIAIWGVVTRHKLPLLLFCFLLVLNIGGCYAMFNT